MLKRRFYVNLEWGALLTSIQNARQDLELLDIRKCFQEKKKKAKFGHLNILREIFSLSLTCKNYYFCSGANRSSIEHSMHTSKTHPIQPYFALNTTPTSLD